MKAPLRRCLSCGKQELQSRLIRFRLQDNVVRIDLRGLLLAARRFSGSDKKLWLADATEGAGELDLFLMRVLEAELSTVNRQQFGVQSDSRDSELCGRSGYLHPNAECLKKGSQPGVWYRAFRLGAQKRPRRKIEVKAASQAQLRKGRYERRAKKVLVADKSLESSGRADNRQIDVQAVRQLISSLQG